MHSSFIDSLVQSTVGFMSTAPIEKCNIAFTPPIARWTFRSESPQKATNFNQSISQPANQPINHPLTHSLTHSFVHSRADFFHVIDFISFYRDLNNHLLICLRASFFLFVFLVFSFFCLFVGFVILLQFYSVFVISVFFCGRHGVQQCLTTMRDESQRVFQLS